MTISLIASRNSITSALEGLALADVSRSGGDTWAKFIYPSPAPRQPGLPEFCQPAKGRWIWGSNEIIISFPKDFCEQKFDVVNLPTKLVQQSLLYCKATKGLRKDA